MRTFRAFFSKSEHFFKRNFNFQKGASTCAPFYYKMKGKREQKHSWKCLSKKNWNSPCNVQEKAFFKKIRWSEISKLFSFFFFFNFTQLTPSTDIFQGFWLDIQLEHFLNNYSRNSYYIRNSYYNRKRSVATSGITKIFKLWPRSLETSFLSGRICLTIDIFSNKQIDREKHIKIF